MSNSLERWLQELGLERYAAVLSAQEVDHTTLADLTDEDLEKLGIPLGPRKKLLRAIAALADVEERRPDPSSDATSPAADMRPEPSAWERTPGERKPVTMLFADITGSTALTERLDSEETHDLLYGAIRRMCEAVESNRGTVCRFMGDGVMAMFGAPFASEHHAVDACRAALQMQRSIGEYSRRVRSQHGSELRIRVGLHSGEVVVLTVGEGDGVEFDASGPAVPIAARMEQSAAPGEIYITEATLSAAGASIEATALAPVSVKGITEPVPVFSLVRVRSVEEEPGPGTRTPFVGRRGELAELRAILDACVAQGRGRAVRVRGEPGIGKTRLVEELVRIAKIEGMSCHRALVLDFGARKGRDAIDAIARSLLGIPRGSDARARERSADAAIERGRIPSDQRVFLNDLLNLRQPPDLLALYDAMDNATRNRGKEDVLAQLLESSARARPALVVVEDIHWIESSLRPYLARLAELATEHPVIVVMTSRIEGDPLGDDSFPDTEERSLSTIELGPLATRESSELVASFIDPTDPFARSCLERSGGNPFFLEQLLRASTKDPAETLPGSIQSLVLSRIDRLPSFDKRALQTASVLGQEFDLETLCYLMEIPTFDCGELLGHGLVRPDESGLRFVHALIRDAAYASLLRRRRRSLHRRAAEWFSRSDAVLHAEHLDRAEDDRAPAAYLRAAQSEAAAYQLEDALRLVERGVALAVAKGQRHALTMLQGALYRDLGFAQRAVDAFQGALDAAQVPAERARAWIGIAEGLRLSEQHPRLLAALNEAETIAEEIGLLAERARIEQLRGNVHFVRGDVEACLGANDASLRHARAAGSPEAEARALSGLADAQYARGRIVSASELFAKCIEVCRAHGLRRIEAANLGMLADGHMYQLCVDEFFEENRAAHALARQLRNPRSEAVALISYTSGLLSFRADAECARPAAERALALSREVGSHALEAFSLVWLGHCERISGELGDAMHHFESSIAIGRAQGMEFCGPLALAGMAYVASEPRIRTSCLAEAEEILVAGCLGHNYLHFYPDAIDLGLREGEWDDTERYCRELERFARDEPLPWCDFWSARGRALAAFGRGRRDPSTIDELERLRGVAQGHGVSAAVPALRAALGASADSG